MTCSHGCDCPPAGRFIPQAAGIAARTVPVLGNQTRGGMEHREKKESAISFATMEKLGMIAVDASKTASVASMTCVEEWTRLSELPRRKPLQSALNGIRAASERPLNGILSGSRHAAGEVKTSFSFEICQSIHLPSVSHPLALSRLTGSLPVAALHRLAPLNPYKTTVMTEDNKARHIISVRRQPTGIHRSQSHRGTETVHPPPCRRVRHDHQQLRAGKELQLQAESEADSKAGRRSWRPL